MIRLSLTEEGSVFLASHLRWLDCQIGSALRESIFDNREKRFCIRKLEELDNVDVSLEGLLLNLDDLHKLEIVEGLSNQIKDWKDRNQSQIEELNGIASFSFITSAEP